MPFTSGSIEVRGAREHNLRSLDLSIPRGCIVAITGVSGSGKSSLAFGTLYAEGQRRYLEALAVQADGLAEALPRPDVDSIEGLPPTLGLAQAARPPHPRSLVAQSGELFGLLRLLFSRLGQAHCWQPVGSSRCDRPLHATPAADVVGWAQALPVGTRLMLLAPLALHEPPSRQALLAMGLSRVRLDGRVLALDDANLDAALQGQAARPVEAVVDRLSVRGGEDAGFGDRLLDSLTTTWRLGGGQAVVWWEGPEGPREERFSEQAVCALHPHIALPALDSKLFSLQAPESLCATCHGLGSTPEDAALPCPTCNGDRFAEPGCGVSLRSAWPLPARLLAQRQARGWPADAHRCRLPDLLHLQVDEAAQWLAALEVQGAQHTVASAITGAVFGRLAPLQQLGLGYLPLDRHSIDLARGELQRLRLAGQLAADMVGAAYILDEPSTGLHANDLLAVAEALKRLRDAGNSVLLVEHDAALLCIADHVIDLGPGAGAEGGQVVMQGSLEALIRCPASMTGRYLARHGQPQALSPAVPPAPLPSATRRLQLQSSAWQQFPALDVRLPVPAMVGICGVSGAGKSRFAQHLLLPALRRALGDTEAAPAGHARVADLAGLRRLIAMDATPIGRSARSTPATYTGLLDGLRQLYATTREAKVRGLGPAHFSFNAKQGRCEGCEGLGIRRIDMHFLPDVQLPCERCGGLRFRASTLAIRYRGLNIAEALAMRVEQAAAFFANHAPLQGLTAALIDVGLAYLRLDQPAAQLSGGEAQRLKMAVELARGGKAKRPTPTLFFFDEPTAGLHPSDVERLIGLLRRLVDDGHTVVVIEHDLEVLRHADWLLKFGPGAGDAGGRLVSQGTPNEVTVGEG